MRDANNGWSTIRSPVILRHTGVLVVVFFGFHYLVRMHIFTSDAFFNGEHFGLDSFSVLFFVFFSLYVRTYACGRMASRPSSSD